MLTTEQIKRRQNICADLLIAIDEDNTLAEEVIDDLISRLTEDEVDQYEHLINNHFGDEQ